VTGPGTVTGAATLSYFLASDTERLHPLAGPPVDADSYVVVASYAGDANHKPGSASDRITIDQAVPAFSITSTTIITNGTSTVTLSGVLRAGSLVPPAS